MLVKLMKYEWKASYKFIILMNLYIVITTIIGIATLIAQIWNTDSESISSFGVLLFIFYFISIILVSSAATIYVAVRFYRTMYSDEAYLIHTLPVSRHHLLFSKTAISTIHLLITSLIVLASTVLLFYFLATKLSPDAKAAIAFEVNISDLSEFASAFAAHRILKIALLIIYFIASSFNAVLLCFSGICLGQLFTKHKIIGSIICYIGLYTVLQVLSSFVILPFTGITLISDIPIPTLIDMLASIELLFILICSAIFYVLSYYLVNKKLNLD